MHDGAAASAGRHQDGAPRTAPTPAAAPVAPGDATAADAASGGPEVDRRQGDRRQGDRRQGDRRQADRRQDAAAAERSVRVRTDRLDRLIDMVGELVIAQSMIARIPPAARARPGPRRQDRARRQDRTRPPGPHHVDAHGAAQAHLPEDGAARARPRPEGRQAGGVRHRGRGHRDRPQHGGRGRRPAGAHGPQRGRPRHRDAGRAAGGREAAPAARSGSAPITPAPTSSSTSRTTVAGSIARRSSPRRAIAACSPNDQHLSDTEVFDLIFAPGFSTAEQITDVSGRGVGMDVVKRNVESLRGRIEIASEAGRGSNFSMRLPLTLAITDGMLVRVGRERYIVPTTAIHMSFRPRALGALHRQRTRRGGAAPRRADADRARAPAVRRRRRAWATPPRGSS